MVGDDYYPTLKAMIQNATDARGEAVLKALHAIIQFAKRHEDGDTAAEFATHLIRRASHEGRIDFEMMGFGELQGLYETNGKLADLKPQVLWYYKWIAEHVPEHADVPKAQVGSFLDRMEEFFRREGAGLRAVHALRCRTAAFMGLRDEADRYFKLWQESPVDRSDDCPACDTHAKVQVLLDLAKIKEAIEAAAPILSGEQSCEEVPATTFSRLLMPLAVVGEGEQSLVCHHVVRRQVRHVPKLIGYLADHVLYLSMLGFGVSESAGRMNFAMLGRAEGLLNDADRFLVARAAYVHFFRLRKSGRTHVAIPRRCELGRSGKPVPIDLAVEFYELLARDIAARFDARHGTTRFQDRFTSGQNLASFEPAPPQEDAP